MSDEIRLEKIDDYRWRIPKSYKPGMKVPGLIYADEKLLKDIHHDKATEQVANVAFLPGIVNYSFAMPDIHWGYGFPIGGVAATDIEEGGVVSPGGVGFDINCLTAESRILFNHGYSVKIKDLENKRMSSKLVCMNFSKKTKEETGIKRYIKIKPEEKVFQIKTSCGHKIKATADHPFWTEDGMVALKRLNIGDKIAIYPFEGVPFEEPKDEVIIDEEDVAALLKKLKKDLKGNAKVQIINQLKKRNLLPLKYNSEVFPYFIKLLGYSTGDGNIHFAKQVKKGISGFWGKKENLELVRKDIEKTGFRCSRIYQRRRSHEIQTRYSLVKFENIEESCKVSSSAFAVMLILLGCPFGNKTENPYSVPNWLFKAPLWQRRLFLAAYFGAEMSSPKSFLEHSYNLYCPVVSMNKAESLVENGKCFLEDIAKLLSEFGVKTHKISQNAEYISKKGTINHRLRLILSNRNENLINLYGRVGFEYNRERSFLGNLTVQFLRYKEKILKERQEKEEQAVKLHVQGFGASKIYGLTGSEFVNLRFIERSIYGEREGEPRVSLAALNFAEYLEENTKNLGISGMVWDKIASVEETPPVDYVYDFTVKHVDHNFIADSFVVSNCGVRLVKTDLQYEDVKDKLQELVYRLFSDVPAGVGSKGDIKVSTKEEKEILVKGSQWAVARGYGVKEDLECTEENGAIAGTDPDAVSERAYERGKAQSGTLGSGNHFLEVQVIDQLFDADLCDEFGLRLGQVMLMIHSGSRGLGYQICEDYVKNMVHCLQKYNINVPDRQLACAPVNSPEAKAYLAAMRCAANYAWANRQCLMHLARLAFERVMGVSWQKLGMELIYDVAHNIAKIEKYTINGKEKNLCVHRKGATRAFPPGHPALPEKYRKTGQPVIIPGDMGRNSYLLVGTEKAVETFYSTCFTGDTRIITDKGMVSLTEIYEFNKLGLNYKALSFNKETMSVEYKPILGVNKRLGAAARISVSQTNRSRFSTLDTTLDHKFSIFENGELKYEEVDRIIDSQKMICVLDKIEIPWILHHPRLAFLIGAIVTDGYIDRKNPRIIFTQKETNEKLNFINYVKSSFEAVFEHGLSEGKIKFSSGIIRGKPIVGTATDFVTGKRNTVQKIASIRDNLQTWVLNLNQESAFNFLAGIIDGDGAWNPVHKVIDIFNSKEEVVGAIVLACLKLGILPYVSIQRENCYIIQISERLEEILKFTKRVKGSPHKPKYGSKLFAIRQLFTQDWYSGNLRWPFASKANRNSLMGAEKILGFLSQKSSCRYNKKQINIAISSPLRMQRVKKIQDLGKDELFNIDVKDNHNYFVITKTFVPVLVKNCHGAGRVKSRTASTKTTNLNVLLKELESKGIIVLASGRRTIVEEAPQAYKDVNDVVRVVHNAGISKRVCRMRPLGVIKS